MLERADTRGTLPRLPHGAYGPAKGERRTILPWLCGLQNDPETLEAVKSSTWSDPSIIHRDMVAARLLLLAWPIAMGLFILQFPVSVQLEGLGALPGVLIFWQRRDKSAVVS